MAKRPSAQAQALMEAERADREENADINEAIARTDSEVFTDAMGDEPLDDEAGTELEAMGEGLEGEDLEEEGEEGEEGPRPEDEETEGGESEESEEDEGDEGDEAAEGEEETFQQPPPQRPQPSIPPRVLRETRERARAEADELRAQLRDMQMRLDNMARQPPPQFQQPPQPPQQPQQPTAQPAPDMFADPEGYRNWVLNEAERRADAKVEARYMQYQQQQRADVEMRLNESLSQTASGPRSYEFNVAYRDLTSLEKNAENAALVRRIVAQPDPGQAILDWWEQSSNPAYIEYHREQVRQAYANARPSRGGPQRQNGAMQNGRVPRHEVRLPRSLSDASGGGSQHMNDPEMMDGAESSIFAYGARR